MTRFFAVWFWRISAFAFHDHRTIAVKATIVKTTNIAQIKSSAGAITAGATSQTNGVRISFLKHSDLQVLENDFNAKSGSEILTRPRIVTGNGAQGSMFVGSSIPIAGTNRNVGLEMSVLPRIKGTSTDMLLTVLSTELVTELPGNQTTNTVSIRTNVAVAAQLRIPSGMGVLLTSDAGEPSGPGGFAVVMQVEIMKE